MTTKAEQKTADWMTTKWRPLMAVTYMATIWFDFIVGPVIFNVLQYWNPGQAITTWTPLTLQGGGLYHLSMGAILGIAAWTRGKEKVAAIESGEQPKGFNVGMGAFPEVKAPEPQWVSNPNQGMTTQQTWAPNPAPTPSYAPPPSYAAPAATYTPAPAPVASTFTSSTGKLGPAPEPFPEL